MFLVEKRKSGRYNGYVREGGVECVSGSEDEQNDGMAICAVREKQHTPNGKE